MDLSSILHETREKLKAELKMGTPTVMKKKFLNALKCHQFIK